ncbi:DNA/RNA non-specific endonuclease [Nonomuraea rubra]|uniref:DNA/RNA non-specific endonuclease n=1 Tax=Nonomuraea rubra TaxID=46180 RepID=UPI00360CAAA1
MPLPALHPELVPLAAINRHAAGGPAYVLDYHHFSVVMNRQRRLAFFTAVNIDGGTSLRIRRDPDRWIHDPRLPHTEQTGEEVYRDNPLDRGHLVRRLDPAWGASHAVAKSGNDDTFHFTNCSPQHKDFNQNQTTWAGLEDYILENADTRDLKATVFTGPVLAADDDPYRGVLLPRQYWKVVAMVKQNGALSATGYLLSQDHLIDGLEAVPGVLLRRLQDLPGPDPAHRRAHPAVVRHPGRVRPLVQHGGGHHSPGDHRPSPAHPLTPRAGDQRSGRPWSRSCLTPNSHATTSPSPSRASKVASSPAPCMSRRLGS